MPARKPRLAPADRAARNAAKAPPLSDEDHARRELGQMQSTAASGSDQVAKGHQALSESREALARADASLAGPKPAQIDRFKEAARRLECDDDEQRFDERMRKLAKAPKGKRQAQK